MRLCIGHVVCNARLQGHPKERALMECETGPGVRTMREHVSKVAAMLRIQDGNECGTLITLYI